MLAVEGTNTEEIAKLIMAAQIGPQIRSSQSRAYIVSVPSSRDDPVPVGCLNKHWFGV